MMDRLDPGPGRASGERARSTRWLVGCRESKEVPSSRTRSRRDRVAEVSYTPQPTRDLFGISAVPIPNSRFELIEAGLLIVDQSATLRPLMSVEGSNKATVGINRSIELQHARDSRKGGTGFAECQSPGIEFWRPDLRSTR
jgi:hypothetical protein